MREAMAATLPLIDQMRAKQAAMRELLSKEDESGNLIPATPEEVELLNALRAESRALNKQLTDMQVAAVESFQDGILAIVDEDLTDEMSAVEADAFRDQRLSEIQDALDRQKKTRRRTIDFLPEPMQRMFGPSETPTDAPGTSSSNPNSLPADTEPSAT